MSLRLHAHINPPGTITCVCASWGERSSSDRNNIKFAAVGVKVLNINFQLFASLFSLVPSPRSCAFNVCTAVGSVVNLLIHPVGAVVIGCVAGALSVLGYRYLSVRIETVFFTARPHPLMPDSPNSCHFWFITAENLRQSPHSRLVHTFSALRAKKAIGNFIQSHQNRHMRRSQSPWNACRLFSTLLGPLCLLCDSSGLRWLALHNFSGNGKLNGTQQSRDDIGREEYLLGNNNLNI